MIWRLIAALMLVAAWGVMASPASAQPAPQPGADGNEAAPFRVALTGRYPPFSFYGSEGQLQGFDVDTAREVGRRLGRPTEIVTNEWAGIIAGLQAGRYDAIVGSMSITPEREEAVLFSRPYYVSGAQLFVRSADAERLARIEDFADELLGVSVGSTYENYVRTHHPGLNVQVYPGESDLFQDMRTGRLGGFVTDRLVGMYNAAASKEDVVPVGPLLYVERCAIPVTRDNAALKQQIDEALDAMERDGFLDNLHIKWFGRAPDKAALEGTADIATMKTGTITLPVVVRVMLLGFGYTLLIAAVAIGVGFVLAVPIGAAIHGGPAPLRWVLVAWCDVIRGTPMLVQLLFVYYGLGSFEALKLSPLQAGMLVMAINASAYMGEVVRAGLMSVPAGQTTGALALGLTRMQAFRFVVWPQAFRIMVPPLMNSVVALLKDTALVSVIGVAEVVTETTKLAAITYRPLELWLLVGALFFVVAFPLMKAAQALETRLKRRGFETEA